MPIYFLERIDAIVDTTMLMLQIKGGSRAKIAKSEALAIVARHSTQNNSISDALQYLESIGHPTNLNALTGAEDRVRQKYGEAIMPYRRD